MERTFFTNIDIKKIRHLENISIPLDKEKRKHLILTGKNGSGKTSVLEAIVKYIQGFFAENGTSLEQAKSKYIRYLNKVSSLEPAEDSEENRQKNYELKKSLKFWEDQLKKLDAGISLGCTSDALLKEKYDQGNFIFAYYKSERKFQIEEYKNIEKIELHDKYKITENPGAKLAKYLVDLKATQAFSKDKAKKWIELDSPNAFAVKCNTDFPTFPVPPFAGILRDIYDIEDYNSNIQLKNDGSIGVSTRVQYNIHGKYDLLVIPQALPKDVDTINNVEVYEIKNNKQVLLKKGTNADISKEAKMNAGKYFVTSDLAETNTKVKVRIFSCKSFI